MSLLSQLSAIERILAHLESSAPLPELRREYTRWKTAVLRTAELVLRDDGFWAGLPSRVPAPQWQIDALHGLAVEARGRAHARCVARGIEGAMRTVAMQQAGVRFALEADRLQRGERRETLRANLRRAVNACGCGPRRHAATRGR